MSASNDRAFSAGFVVSVGVPVPSFTPKPIKLVLPNTAMAGAVLKSEGLSLLGAIAAAINSPVPGGALVPDALLDLVFTS